MTSQDRTEPHHTAPSSPAQGSPSTDSRTSATTGKLLPAGALVLAGTPIGNLGDATQRLREVLATADVIAAEDTRRTRKLASGLGITLRGRLVAHHEHNEASSAGELLTEVRTGHTVLVVSDAGMPTVSDPGYRVAAAAAAEGLPITVLPGPSAVLSALAVSGLPSDRFVFEGFLPRKSGQREARLTELATEQRTMVFYEAPHRLVTMLTALEEAFGGQRPGVVARELTKLHEEVLRGTLRQLRERVEADGVRGEIVVVVQGAPAPEPEKPEDLVEEVEALVADGVRLKDAAGAVAGARGVSKRELYESVLVARDH
ncbi:16S rRNA (cytidine(1402)-2'-O)-methyltransferase [Kocuria sp.]|uniref:16S rRNA (cytidine(1402)-2'-O)-methyltransferase n=1 Tax=Kocuria sp. TaxID=1871328 RepID=UPI0026E0B2C4|nr:16S rRNA (cytidine(1402)-2'-O)-methyltransferase [Kocuria sp.]MDO5617498.1 16S rRNA (cytidine(1402)-2'-O)-methyltransferase [Kocuria sp.]